MLPDTESIKGMYVYEYTFLDDLSFIETPQKYLESRFSVNYTEEEVKVVVDAVRDKFLASGWEGDGDIGVIWLPPFVDSGIEDTWGNYLWHVKQSNNGISFLLSEYPLDFSRIKEQNWSEEELQDKGTPASIVQHKVDQLRQTAVSIKKVLSQKLNGVKEIKDETLKESIMSDILLHNQGILVGNIHEFLDGCYLMILIEALNGNSSGIKLKKSRVQLFFTNIDEEKLDPDANTWLTIQGIISDLWKSYKFEPYKSKIEMLFKSIDFEWNKDNLSFLGKHVALRNCVQHHEGHLDRDSLQQAGASSFTILGPDGDVKIEMGNLIQMTRQELEKFCDILIDLSNEFGGHVYKRVPARHYVKNQSA
jgi:hypothetical protein